MFFRFFWGLVLGWWVEGRGVREGVGEWGLVVERGLEGGREVVGLEV